MPVDHLAAVESAWKKLEEAWPEVLGIDTIRATFLAVDSYLAARRAAQNAGYAAVMVSKEAVEALRRARAYRIYPCAEPPYEHTKAETLDFLACEALARDLAALLKPDGRRA